MVLLLTISLILLTITLCGASYRDILTRKVPFRYWMPLLLVALPFSWWYYVSASGSVLVVTAILCGIFYFLVVAHAFGGADGWAFIFTTILVPVHPFDPWWGITIHPYFPLTVFANTLVINLVALSGYWIVHWRVPVKIPMVPFITMGVVVAALYGDILATLATYI